jgi:nucleoside-diphosphate-sugar epimerase
VAQADVVLHLAAKTKARNARELDVVNVAGTRKLAEACAACANPPRLVVVSSLAAAGPGTPERPRRETSPCQPVSNYGRSKLAAEWAARDFADRVPMCIVRPPLVFGAGDRDGRVLIRSIARTGWHVVPRRGLPLSVIHAEDLAQILLRVSQRGQPVRAECESAGVYHVAHPEPSSLGEIGQLIGEALGKRCRVLKVRGWAFAVAAAGGELAARLGRPPSVLNWDKLRESLQAGWVTSTDKLVDELDYRVATATAERYRETVEYEWGTARRNIALG